jgi:hypothetical protein
MQAVRELYCVVICPKMDEERTRLLVCHVATRRHYRAALGLVPERDEIARDRAGQ